MNKDNRIPYCHDCLTFDGKIWSDLECMLEVEVGDGPDYPIDVTGVYVKLHPTGEIDMIGKQATQEMRIIGFQIVEDAERDDKIIAQARAREGIWFRGLGPNDPGGRFVRAG